jgi:hypothetical protein
MTDLIYLKQGLFTTFLPETEQGMSAWHQIAEKTNGTGKIFTIHLKNTLEQLRKSGYTVKKAKPCNMSMDEILKELEELEGNKK